MDAQEQTFEQLLQLEDIWTGSGRAEYPTIPTFGYREALTIQAVPGQPRLFILQRTQKKNPDGEWVESHWESGFLRVLADDAVEWVDAQANGRVEVLRGTSSETEDGLLLSLDSTLVGNDGRMRNTARQFTLRGGNALSYTMQMAMTHTPDLTLHLESALTRFVDKQELLSRLDEGRKSLLELIAALPAPSLAAPNRAGQGSVPDLIAQLIAHEQSALEKLNAAALGHPIETLEAEKFLASAASASQNQSPAETLRAWDESYARLNGAISELPDSSFDPFSPACVALADTIDGAVAKHTYVLYAEQLDRLKLMLGANSQARV